MNPPPYKGDEIECWSTSDETFTNCEPAYLKDKKVLAVENLEVITTNSFCFMRINIFEYYLTTH